MDNKDFTTAHYILKRRKPIPVNDYIQWMKLFSTKKHKVRVRASFINGYYISTVFLGLDHSHSKGPPLLFETMIFSTHKNAIDYHYQTRCTTWRQALKMHQTAKRYIKKAAKNG